MCVKPSLVAVRSLTFGTTMYIDAPCGKCIECVKARQNSWKLRLCEESKNWPYGWFFTLTYAPEHLPMSVNEETGEMISTACKKDVQLWIKRMRTDYQRKTGERMKMKYFICSEYGFDNEYVDSHGVVRKGTARPHYHGVLYTDASPNSVVPYFNSWARDIGYVNYSSISVFSRESCSATSNYVSKYCCKGEFSTRVSDIEAGYIEPAWLICSKGIGESYVDRMKSYHLLDREWPDGIWSERDMNFTYDNVSDFSIFNDVFTVLERMRVRDGDYFYKMPRYWRDRIYGVKRYDKRLQCTKRPNLRLCAESIGKPILYGSVRNPYKEPITYHVKEVQVLRYVHENFLSVSMLVCLQRKFLFEYKKSIRALRRAYPKSSDFELDSLYFSRRKDSLLYREKESRQKLYDFYFSNSTKYPQLNYA